MNEKRVLRRGISGKRNGDTIYHPPGILNRKVTEIVNLGNVIDCGAVGGGHLGSNIAHDNEAPFPLKLAEFFVRSFCPPGGTVLDCFAGSGTTLHAAIAHGRRFIGMDLRSSQLELMKRRVKQARLTTKSLI